MEKNPWWKNVSGPFPKWEGPVGCKADGGGCHRARGKVGEMRIHRAVHNKDIAGAPHSFGITYRSEWLTRIIGARLPGTAYLQMETCGPLLAEIKRLVEAGENVNEVEAAGNTPLHAAAYEGWIEGIELLLSLKAKIDASNNAGDRAYHWAENMAHKDVMELLVKVYLVQSP